MPKLKKVCRVCGKEYESCRTIKTGNKVFNWREMCCSPECGQIYFQRIEEARNPAPKMKDKKGYIRREIAAKEIPIAQDKVSVIADLEQMAEAVEEK